MHNPALLQHARGITNKVLGIPAIPSLCPAPPPPTCRTLPSAGLKLPPSLQREAESRASLSSWSPSPWGLCLGREVTTRGQWHGVDLVQHNALTWGKCWLRFHQHDSSALMQTVAQLSLHPTCLGVLGLEKPRIQNHPSPRAGEPAATSTTELLAEDGEVPPSRHSCSK